MKLCSGRWRVALGLGAALAVLGGFSTTARAGDRPLFPWRKQQAPAPLPTAPDRSNIVVLPDALTLEEETPLTSIAQATKDAPKEAQKDAPKTPSSSTGQSNVPSPPPPINRPAPLTGSQPTTKPETLTPVPNTTMGEVLGGPVIYEQGDPYPLFYRDRPQGSKAEKAEIITSNRSNEHAWYREWRCRYYGYYPTQWRPFPEGWHLGRNIPPAPYAHPYDLKQPEPDPSNPRPKTRSQQEQAKPTPSTDRNAPGPTQQAPPLRQPGTNPGATPQQGKGLSPNPSTFHRPGLYP